MELHFARQHCIMHDSKDTHVNACKWDSVMDGIGSQPGCQGRLPPAKWLPLYTASICLQLVGALC